MASRWCSSRWTVPTTIRFVARRQALGFLPCATTRFVARQAPLYRSTRTVCQRLFLAGQDWSSLARTGPRRPAPGPCWPALAFSTWTVCQRLFLAGQGWSSLARTGPRCSSLARTGPCWPALAFAGRHWSALVPRCWASEASSRARTRPRGAAFVTLGCGHTWLKTPYPVRFVKLSSHRLS